MARGPPDGESDVGEGYERYPLRFTAGATPINAMLEIRVSGGPVLIGTASLMPGDNVRGMRADTLALLKQLNALRCTAGPAGISSAATTGETASATATVARRARTRLGPGSSTTISAWTNSWISAAKCDRTDDRGQHGVRRCLLGGSTGRILQRVRRDAGRQLASEERTCRTLRRPYWCVGNEMWGPWQLGFMQLQHYTLKHNQVAEAMWRSTGRCNWSAAAQLGTINRQHDPNEKRTWSEGHAPRVRRAHEPDRRALLSQQEPGQPARPRQSTGRFRPRESRRPPPSASEHWDCWKMGQCRSR
jgi:alpha-L-arabinofuranosidase